MQTFVALAAVRAAKCLSPTLISKAQQRVTLSSSLFNVIRALSPHKYDVTNKFSIFTFYELRKHEATIFFPVSELGYGSYEFTRKEPKVTVVVA